MAVMMIGTGESAEGIKAIVEAAGKAAKYEDTAKGIFPAAPTTSPLVRST